MSTTRDEDVAPELVALFNKAAELGRRGKQEESLAAYREVLNLHLTQHRPASPRFLAMTRMQMSYTLLDLGHVDEARKELEAIEPLAVFKGEGLYSYYFTYGNTLGALGKLDAMFLNLVEAIGAAEDLDDYTERPLACWKNILKYGVAAKDWKFTLTASEKAIQVARVRQIPELEKLATSTGELAKTELAK